MPRTKKVVVESTSEQVPTESPQVVAPVIKDASAELVSALVQAIQSTKPIEKKNPFNRKVGTPWTPKDGSPKLKLKRKMYQHSIPIDPDMTSNETIALLNQLKPGRFMDNWVKVTKRRDMGIDITYPIRTASQRLKMVNSWGIRDFNELLARCIEEAGNPAKYHVPEDYD